MTKKEFIKKTIKILSKIKNEKEMKLFLEFLKRKRKMNLLPQIKKEYERKILAKRKILIEIPFPFSQNTLEKIKKRYQNLFPSNPLFEVKIKKELIAGFEIKSQNFLLKNSFKSFLEKYGSN